MVGNRMLEIKGIATKFLPLWIRICIFVLFILALLLALNIGALPRWANAHDFNPITELSWAGFYRSDMGVTDSSGNVISWLSQEGGATMSVSGTQYPTVMADYWQSGVDGMRFNGASCLFSNSAIPNGQTGYVIAYFTGEWGVAEDISGRVLQIGQGNNAVYYLSMVVPLNPSTSNPYTEIQQRNNDTADFVRGGTSLSPTGRYIIEWWSDGSDYFIAIDGVSESLTIRSGANSGDWAGDVATKNTWAIGSSVAPSGCGGNAVKMTVGIIGIMDDIVPSDQQRDDLRWWIWGHFDDQAEPTPTPTITPTPTPTPRPFQIGDGLDRVQSATNTNSAMGDILWGFIILGGGLLLLFILRVPAILLLPLGMLLFLLAGLLGLLPLWPILAAIMVGGLILTVIVLTRGSAEGSEE